MTAYEFTEWAFAIFCAFLILTPVVAGTVIGLGWAVATVVKWWKENRND